MQALFLQGKFKTIPAHSCARPILILISLSARQGLNWFGSEGDEGVVEGLVINPASFYFEFMAANKFNAVRLLFNHESVNINGPIPLEMVNPIKNHNLFTEWGGGVSYVEHFRQLAITAADSNVLVLMAAHRLSPLSWPGDGLWYDDDISEQATLDSWTKLADALCGQWNVVAVDLFNGEHAVVSHRAA